MKAVDKLYQALELIGQAQKFVLELVALTDARAKLIIAIERQEGIQNDADKRMSRE